MNINFRRMQSGFTFIEILFVIVFLSIVMLYSLSLSKDRAREDAMARATVGIKNWQQAVLAYYADHNTWPTDINAVAGDYLPPSQVCAPFAGNTSGSVCPSDTLVSYVGEPGCPSSMGSGSNLQTGYKCFIVSVATPDSATAASMAPQLPSGYTSGNTVYSSVPLPGAKQGYITSAGVVTQNPDSTYGDSSLRQFWLPPCEPGFEPHYFTTPMYYTTGFKQGATDISPRYSVLLGMGGLYPKDDRWLVYAYTSFSESEDITSKGFVYYITYCSPENTWCYQRGNGGTIGGQSITDDNQKLMDPPGGCPGS